MNSQQIIQITGDSVGLTNAIRDFIHKKFEPVLHHAQHLKLSSIHLVLGTEKQAHTAKATLHLKGLEINAHASSTTLYNAIEALVDKLLLQLNKHKDKLISH